MRIAKVGSAERRPSAVPAKLTSKQKRLSETRDATVLKINKKLSSGLQSGTSSTPKQAGKVITKQRKKATEKEASKLRKAIKKADQLRSQEVVSPELSGSPTEKSAAGERQKL